MSAQQIATRINDAGQTYYGDRAKAWERDGIARIYFGRDYVTIEAGEAHNRKAGKARSQTIGESAVELVESAMTA